MNETKVSDERLRLVAANQDAFDGDAEDTAAARELLAHRASRPLEQAVVEAARRWHVAQYGSSAEARAADALGLAVRALDAAAKQAGGGATAGSLSYIVSWRCRCGATGDGRGDDMRAHFAACPTAQSINAPAPSPAPSSPPMEDAMTPEQRANEVTGVVGHALGMTDQLALARKVIEQVRAASSAAAERAGRGWKEANEDLCAQLAAARAEIARLKPAQPAAGGEAGIRGFPHRCPVCDGGGLVMAFGSMLPDVQCPVCKGDRIIWSGDWPAGSLDARSSARAGG